MEVLSSLFQPLVILALQLTIFVTNCIKHSLFSFWRKVC
jgi:hypothetical protein